MNESKLRQRRKRTALCSSQRSQDLRPRSDECRRRRRNAAPTFAQAQSDPRHPAWKRSSASDQTRARSPPWAWEDDQSGISRPRFSLWPTASPTPLMGVPRPTRQGGRSAAYRRAGGQCWTSPHEVLSGCHADELIAATLAQDAARGPTEGARGRPPTPTSRLGRLTRGDRICAETRIAAIAARAEERMAISRRRPAMRLIGRSFASVSAKPCANAQRRTLMPTTCSRGIARPNAT